MHQGLQNERCDEAHFALRWEIVKCEQLQTNKSLAFETRSVVNNMTGTRNSTREIRRIL